MRKYGTLLSILIYSLLFIVPLVFVLSNADMGTIADAWKDEYLRHTVVFTFTQAAISTLFSVILGLPGAWILSRYKFKAERIVKLIYYVPFVLPSILVVLGFVTAYGKSGLLNRLLGTDLKLLYSFPTVIAAHVFYNFPVISNLVSEKLNSLDSNIEDEARSAGASEFLIFKRITLPRISSSIISASILVFLFCFTSFAIILVLGGSPKLTTMEVEIYRQARISLNIEKAGSLALISLFTASVSVLLYNLFADKDVEEYPKENKQSLNKTKPLTRILVHTYLSVTVTFLVLPIAGILLKSINSDLFSNISFIPIANTFLIGVLSTLITELLAVFVCSYLRGKKQKYTESVFLLPLATSSIIIGLGYFVISKYLNFIPDFILLVLCHGVLNIPYAVKSILPVYRSLPSEQVEAAEIDGLNDSGILRKIELPYIRNSILSSFGFCFALSCGELNTTIMIAGGKFTTIPLQIQKMISGYNYRGACAYGIVLVIICTAVFMICDKLKAR